MAAGATAHAVRPAGPSVEFKRILEAGIDPGADVRAVKRVMSRLGCKPWAQFDDVFHDPQTTQEIKKTQLVLSVAEDGQWGNDTHTASLAAVCPEETPHAGEWAWDQTSQNLYNGFADTTAAEAIVKAIFAFWHQMEDHKDTWHYSQHRPIDYKSGPGAGGQADCSGTVLMAAKAAGAKSPDVKFGYTGWGNTDSLRVGGSMISLADVGRYCQDHYVLAFFGSSWDSTDHVIAAETPTAWHSDGSESAPDIWSTIHWDPNLNFIGCRAYAVI